MDEIQKLIAEIEAKLAELKGKVGGGGAHTDSGGGGGGPPTQPGGGQQP